MNKLKFLFLFCIIQQISFTQVQGVENQTLQTYDLKGKVRMVEETSFKAFKNKNQFVQTGKAWQYEWEHDKQLHFDTIGNLSLQKDLIEPKNRVSYSIKYDEKKRIIEVNQLYTQIFYTYDASGTVISSKEIRKPDLEMLELLEEEGAEKADEIVDIKYFYDNNKLLIKKEEFLGKEKIAFATYAYDAKKNLILLELHEDDFIDKNKYQYDENNLLIREEWSDNESGVYLVMTKKYEGKELIYERMDDFEEGKADGFTEVKYENGNPVEMIETNPDGSIVKSYYTYEFDSQGNWIRQIIDANGKYYVIQREISYY